MAWLPVNVANVVTASGAPDYPAGEYLVKINSYELRTNNDGEGQRVAWSCEFVMGPGPGNVQFAGKKVFHSSGLAEKNLPFLKRFFVICGITEEFIAQNNGYLDPDWLLGRTFMATGGKNAQGYFNLSRERPASEWNKLGQPRQAPTPAAPPPTMLQPTPQVAQAPIAMQPAQAVQPMMAVPAPIAAPALPTPTLPAPGAGIPVGIPAPVPPPGNVGH